MGARVLLALSLVLSGSMARAADDDPPLRLSLVVATVPQASLRSSREEPVSHTGAERALAAGAALDYACGETLSLGIGSQYVFWVQQELRQGPAEGSEMDIHVRIGANSRLTEDLRLFALLAPGYSYVVKSPFARTANDPRGLVVAGKVGATVDLLPALFLSGEIGYQEGFQSGRHDGVTFDYQTRFMHVGLGLGLRLL